MPGFGSNEIRHEVGLACETAVDSDSFCRVVYEIAMVIEVTRFTFCCKGINKLRTHAFLQTFILVISVGMEAK